MMTTNIYLSFSITNNCQFFTLNESLAPLYEELTYPHFRNLLHNLNSDISIIAIGVTVEKRPIGLILARYFSEDNQQIEGQILSWFVVPNYRGQGIGTELLVRMESQLKDRGCAKIELNYLSNPNNLKFERILSKQNWLIPKVIALVCYASTAKVEQTKDFHLIHYLYRLSSQLAKDYVIFPWYNLTSEERKLIEKKMEIDPLVSRFNPFFEEDKLETLNSLGLRYQNHVVGWVITHRISPDTIRYTQMFVHPEAQILSQSVLLLAKAIQLQVQAKEATKGTFRVDIDNTPMVNFVYRRLAPYLEDIRKSLKVSKHFN